MAQNADELANFGAYKLARASLYLRAGYPDILIAFLTRFQADWSAFEPRTAGVKKFENPVETTRGGDSHPHRSIWPIETLVVRRVSIFFSSTLSRAPLHIERVFRW